MGNNSCELQYWLPLFTVPLMIGYVIGMLVATVLSRRAERKRLSGEWPPLPMLQKSSTRTS